MYAGKGHCPNRKGKLTQLKKTEVQMTKNNKKKA
jgi:hypothetical protein